MKYLTKLSVLCFHIINPSLIFLSWHESLQDRSCSFRALPCTLRISESADLLRLQRAPFRLLLAVQRE